MKLQRNYLFLVILSAAITLPGCYTQLQTTQYEKAEDEDLGYYYKQSSSSSSNYSGERQSADVRLQYRNYEAADWYRDHYVTPAASYNTYNSYNYNDYYMSPYYSPGWHDRYYTGFYHDPFYRSYYQRPWRSGFRSYWSLSFGMGHGWYSYPTYGWSGWYGGYDSYGYYGGYGYNPYYYGGVSRVDSDRRYGPRDSGVQRTTDRNRANRGYIDNRNNQGSGNTLRPTGTQSTVNRGNSGRTRSVDRNRNSGSRSRGTVNRGNSGSNRSSGDRSRSSGRSGRQTSSAESADQSSYDSYEAAMQANTTAQERARAQRYDRSRSSGYQFNSGTQQSQSAQSNNHYDQNRTRRVNPSYSRPTQPNQFRFDNNRSRSSNNRSSGFMRNSNNFNRSQGTQHFKSQSRSSGSRIQRSSSSSSRSSGSSGSSGRSRSSGRDR